MAAYKIFFRQSVLKDIAGIPKRELQRIIKRIESLAVHPKSRGCEKIVGNDRFKIRQGNYRIVYSIQHDDLTIWIVKIGHRRDIYRNLKKDKPSGKVHE